MIPIIPRTLILSALARAQKTLQSEPDSSHAYTPLVARPRPPLPPTATGMRAPSAVYAPAPAPATREMQSARGDMHVRQRGVRPGHGQVQGLWADSYSREGGYAVPVARHVRAGSCTYRF